MENKTPPRPSADKLAAIASVLATTVDVLIGKRPELGFKATYSDSYGYHSPNAFSATYLKHLMRKCALNVDMHVDRHIAAKGILGVDPSAMGLIQEILERKRIETTRAHYAEVSKLLAQKRYLQFIDKATLRALGKLDFRVGLETQLGR